MLRAEGGEAGASVWHHSLAQTFGDGEACGDGTSKRRSATVRFSCCHGSEAPPPKQGAQGSTAAMKKE